MKKKLMSLPLNLTVGRFTLIWKFEANNTKLELFKENFLCYDNFRQISKTETSHVVSGYLLGIM